MLLYVRHVAVQRDLAVTDSCSADSRTQLGHRLDADGYLCVSLPSRTVHLDELVRRAGAAGVEASRELAEESRPVERDCNSP